MAAAIRARSIGLACGKLEPGPTNAITDVPGVLVGHKTLIFGVRVRTGVTAVLPHAGNVFADRPLAAVEVLNGNGASTGTMFVQESGVLETPILLSNTFAIGACSDALIRHSLQSNPQIGRSAPSVHPLVLECNDGFLNDIQAMPVAESDAHDAIAAAGSAFALGSVGAGTGMSCFGLKGGIGTASRRVLTAYERGDLSIGVLVLANFGRNGDLRLPDGRVVIAPEPAAAERGSIIVLIGTNVPLEHRQLRRLARRAGAGIALCGSHWGHGSGDVFVAFTTANRVQHESPDGFFALRSLEESLMDELFRACVEATQESILDALVAAEPMTGFGEHHRTSLRDLL